MDNVYKNGFNCNSLDDATIYCKFDVQYKFRA